MPNLIWVEDAVIEYGVSRRKLYRWLKEKRLARYRQGPDARRTYVDRAELKKLLRPAPAVSQRSEE